MGQQSQRQEKIEKRKTKEKGSRVFTNNLLGNVNDLQNQDLRFLLPHLPDRTQHYCTMPRSFGFFKQDLRDKQSFLNYLFYLALYKLADTLPWARSGTPACKYVKPS